MHLTNNLSQHVLMTTIAKNFGLNVFLKLHIRGYSDGLLTSYLIPTDLTGWFNNWKSVCDIYASFCHSSGIDTLFITNENYNLTTTEYYKYWNNLISYLHADYPNVKIGISLNKKQYSMLDSSILKLFDVVGYNFYPNLTTISTAEDYYTLQRNFYYDIENYSLMNDLFEIKEKYKKKLYITEIGCQSVVSGLQTGNNVTDVQSDEVQALYYNLMFDIVWNSNIDGLFIWQIGNINYLGISYFFQNRINSEKIVSDYWGGTL